tara:strand:- start:15076 stop:15858 length:783 start_codon:yes stop_codon:yes gene_type:complete
MSKTSLIKSWLAGGSIAVVLSGCSISTLDTGTFVAVPEDRARISVNAASYIDVTPQRVGFADSQEREEYALYRGADGQAEILYVETRSDLTRELALEFNKLIVDTVKMWRFHQGHTLSFEKTTSIKNDIAQFWVQPFQQTDTGRQCVGFSSTWDTRSDDPELRPSKLMFGYHCVPSGKTLPDDGRAFVASLQVRGVSIPLRVKTAYDLKAGDAPLPSRDQQTSNLVLAQDGAGGGVSGLPAFPLLIARHYNTNDGKCTNC